MYLALFYSDIHLSQFLIRIAVISMYFILRNNLHEINAETHKSFSHINFRGQKGQNQHLLGTYISEVTLNARR